MNPSVVRRVRSASLLVVVLLLVEFLDELVFGATEAAWPLIQRDLLLSYAQIGLLFTIPSLIASLIEPVFGILADMGHRRRLILGGGVVFALSLIGVATSQSMLALLVVSVLLHPASGAFVSLSQAALMDYEPARHEQNMARWTFAGSLGVVGGALLLSAVLALGGTWRTVVIGLSIFSALVVMVVWRISFAEVRASSHDDAPQGLIAGLREALNAVRDREVLRWLVLLECSNLMMDVLYSYIALYFVNVVGVSPGQAALGVSAWTIVGLVGDFLLIPLLERVSGLAYLRISVVIELVLYPAFLLVESFEAKLVILAVIGFFNAGWYAILMGQLYSTLPGRSGTALAVSNVFGIVGSFLPLIPGLIADQIGLAGAMWFLLLGPIGLLIGLWRRR
ncbi:MAG: MFS transporter [Anaerolineae bacterium]|nr:MFS transporter [Anaerolineae bacterium]